jgi:hypothetical protein
MTEVLQHLVDALREELQQYGEMLALTEHQQELIASRAAPQLIEAVQAVNAQMGSIRDARERREARQRELARLLCAEEDSPLATLVPFLSDEYRVLVGALVEENNELLQRVRQRVRQNHLLLARSVELLQRLVDSLLATARTTVYDDSGHLAGNAGGHRPLWNTVA